MQGFRWYLGVIATLVCALAAAQVPGTIPPIKLPPVKVPVKPVPGMAAALEAQRPFIARYAYCNAMQLYQSRRAAWEPIYRDSGATTAELDAYSGDLVAYIKEFCSNGRPANYWQAALARVEAFDKRVDSAVATNLGIGLHDATQIRISRLLAQLEDFRERCLGGGQAAMGEDQLSVFGSLLPATTAPPGLALEPRQAAASTGKCSSGAGSAGTGLSSRGLDRETLSACTARALAQSSACVSPVGEGPQGEPIDTQNFGGKCADIAGGTACTSRTRYVYANGALSDVEKSTTTVRGRDGRTHTIESIHRLVVGNDGEVISDYNRVSADGRPVAVYGTGDEAADISAAGDEASAPPAQVPAGYRAVVRTLGSGVRAMDVVPIGRFNQRSGPTEYEGRLGARASGSLVGFFAGVAARLSAPGRGRDCASVSPQSAEPLGLALHVSSAGEGSPIRAGRLNTMDMVGQCVCNSLGRLGPGLAASSGFSCGPDANTHRLDCLMNPSGPTDGIRPECIEYLHADNPGRDTPRALSEWCGRVAQCPTGAGMAAISSSGGATCSCRTGLAAPRGGGSGTPGGSICARVSCAQGPGAAGSDLYRQCCGVRGDSPLPIDPSTGSPVPPRPGPPESSKQPLPKLPAQALPKVPMQPLPPE